MSLAKKCNIDWETVAKVNKIPPPYTIITGQKILLPYSPNPEVIHHAQPSTPTNWKKFTIKTRCESFRISGKISRRSCLINKTRKVCHHD